MNEVPTELIADALAGVASLMVAGDSDGKGSEALSAMIKYASEESLPIFEMAVNRMRARRNLTPIQIKGRKDTPASFPCDIFPEQAQIFVMVSVLKNGCKTLGGKEGLEVFQQSIMLLESLMQERAVAKIKEAVINEPW